MSNLTLTPFLEKHNFVQGDKPLKFIKETEHGPLELLFQPLKKTKYAGEIRHREFVGCRVNLSLNMNVPSRIMVGDADAISNPVANFVNKKRGRELLKNINDDLAAWVAAKSWSESILRAPEVQDAFAILFHSEARIRRQQSLSLDPLNLTYTYRMKSVDLEVLPTLIPPFLRVAEEVSQAGEPPEKLGLSTFEKQVLKRPYLVAILILLGLMLLLVVPFIIIGIGFFKIGG